MDITLDFSVFSHFLVVSTSATDCLKRLVSEMTCYMLSGMLNCTTTAAFHCLHSATCMVSCKMPSFYITLFTVCCTVLQMGACFAKVFNGCPLHINCTASWINAATKGELLLMNELSFFVIVLFVGLGSVIES